MNIIAVSTSGIKPDSTVEPVIGRADFFLFFDKQGNFIRAAPNPHRDLRQNSGTLVAKYLSEAGARAVLGGNVGPRAALALRQAGIIISFPHSGPADEAVRRFLTSRTEAP